MKKLFLSLLIPLYSVISVYGQQLLLPEDAISIALKNSYDIQVARTSTDIDKVNNTAGNAGMLPSVGINASDAYAHNNSRLESQSGDVTSASNVHSNTFAADAALNWTLFDGGKMFVTKKKLSSIEALGEIQFRDQVMQTLYNVIVGYFDVVRQKQELASINEVINYNQERVKILQASFNAGLVPKTDLLQSQVDLNVYLEDAILQETVITVAKRNLNQLLSRDPDVPFEVVDTIELNYVPDKADLSKKLFANNTQFLISEKQLDIAHLSIREFSAQRLPWVSFNAGYYFLQGDNPVGSVVKNTTYGPQVGGILTFPIFNSGDINRQVKVARLQHQSANFGMESTKIQVNTQLQNALTTYEQVLRLLNLEKSNTVLARENLTIAMHRLRLGQTTALEVRQAEESFEQSLNRLIQFEYTAKVAETKLKQLISGL
jgi:outer membrane protein